MKNLLILMKFGDNEKAKWGANAPVQIGIRARAAPHNTIRYDFDNTILMTKQRKVINYMSHMIGNPPQYQVLQHGLRHHVDCYDPSEPPY